MTSRREGWRLAETMKASLLGSGQEPFGDERQQDAFGRIAIEAEDETGLLGSQRQSRQRRELLADALERGTPRGGVSAVDRWRHRVRTRLQHRLSPFRLSEHRTGEGSRDFLHHRLRQTWLDQNPFDSRSRGATFE